MTVTYCGDNFCVPKKPNIDIACHDLGKEAGKWIMYDNAGVTCYCICSCLGEGTNVTIGNGLQVKVEDIVQNKTSVLAAGKDLKFSPLVVQSLVGTKAGETKNTIYLGYTCGGKKIERVVTMDHPFFLANGDLVGAGVLQLDDSLLDEKGQPVQVDSIRWGSYIGRFWEFATSMQPPDENLDGHLVLTEGVVTGDYAISVFLNFPVNATEVEKKGSKDRPFIGSPEWADRNGVNPGSIDEGVSHIGDGVFVPAEGYAQEVPENASAFLPEYQALALELFASKEPLSNSYILDMCEFLIEFVFEPHYPDIKFCFNWYDNSVNSHSWVDTITNQQVVYLSGGLARIKGFEIEGVTMAIAHEVGHLLGRPKLESGVTCEGQADWFGGSIILRTVWFGEQYFIFLKAAIKQLDNLYKSMIPWKKSDPTLVIEPPETDEDGQSYPSNKCRILTYKDAMSTPTAPTCSLCSVTEDEDYDEDEWDDEDMYIAEGFDKFEDEDVSSKSSGARDRQRKKKRRMGEEELELTAKSSGARDRQRKKKRRMGEEEFELMAKAPGARDRQRKKKRRLEEDDSDVMAKVAGARDRQRKKKR